MADTYTTVIWQFRLQSLAGLGLMWAVMAGVYGLLADRGIRRVVTPPEMVGAYYDRLGFRREGESYVLEL